MICLVCVWHFMWNKLYISLKQWLLQPQMWSWSLYSHQTVVENKLSATYEWRANTFVKQTSKTNGGRMLVTKGRYSYQRADIKKLFALVTWEMSKAPWAKLKLGQASFNFKGKSIPAFKIQCLVYWGTEEPITQIIDWPTGLDVAYKITELHSSTFFKEKENILVLTQLR